MNPTSNNMKVKLFITIAAAGVIACGCVSKPSDGAIEMEEVVESENNHKTPFTKEDFLAVSDSASNFYFTGDSELMQSGENAFWLMNRMMQMYSEVVFNKEYWEWGLAMNETIDQYSAKVGASRSALSETDRQNAAMDDVAKLIYVYSGKAQSAINAYTFVCTIQSLYKTVSEYISMAEVLEPDKRNLLREEFSAWHSIIDAQISLFCDYTLQGDHYSALGMDINMKCEEWIKARHEKMLLEKKIISGEPMRLKPDSLRKIDFAQLPDEFRELEPKIEEWLSARKKVEAALPKSTQSAYHAVTIRMHNHLRDEILKLSERNILFP